MKNIFGSALVLVAILSLLVFSTGWLRDLMQISSLLVLSAIYTLFISSLRPHQTPLISRYAILMDPEIGDKELRYTRKVTWAWVILLSLFFIIKIEVLFFSAEWHILQYRLNHSVDVLFLLSSGFLFIGELYLRCWIFPEKTHDSLIQFIQKTCRISLKDIWTFKRPESK